jgi:phage terminase small subunit
MSEKSAKSGLTIKQRRFVEEYAADPNAVQAYFKAYGRVTDNGTQRSYGVAAVSAHRLLQNPKIQAELERAQESWSQRVAVSKERVLAELAALAFLDPADLYEPDESGMPVPRHWRTVPAAARKAIAKVKVKRKRLKSDSDATAWEVEELEYQFHSKTDALEKLCKRLNLFAGEAEQGGTAAGVSVEFLATLVAKLGAVHQRSGSAGEGAAVGAESGATVPSVPEPS